MTYSSNVFAANLRAERARRRLSQDELADKVGVSRIALAKYESGEMTPGADKVCDLASALQCTPNDLCGWADN